MIVEVFHYYAINNVDIPTGYLVLYGLIQLLFLASSAMFLGLFIWSIKLYA